MIRTAKPTQAIRFPTISDGLRRSLQINRWLTFYGLLSTALVLIAFTLSLVDQRLVTGAPVWYKPLKFSISLAINAFTLLWLLHFVQGRRRWISIAANTVAVTSLMEIVIIAGQAFRGMRSHFNVATVFDGVLYNIMGIVINFMWIAMIAITILIMIQRFQKPAFAWALRLGMVITLASSIVTGYMMVGGPNTVDAVTGQVIAAGAHSVGVADGGPGLPFLGWSTEAGDLRAAHFFGLHAIQVLALLGGIVSSRRWRKLHNGHRLGLVWTAALGYAGFVVLATWQALRAEPLLAPGLLTLSTLAALMAAVAVSAGGIVWHARNTG